MRNLLILLVLLLWLALGWKMCTDYTACCGEEVAAVVPPSDASASIADKAIISCAGTICFEKNKCEPIFGDSWISYRDSIINSIENGGKIVVSGYYATDEKNNSDFDNLGVCRANAVRQAFLNERSSLNADVQGQLRVGLNANSGNVLSDNFAIQVLSAAASSGGGSTEKDLEEIRMSTLIYFPFNSTNKLSDASVETYLRQVATRVKSSGERVRLTGHTDSIGGSSYNMNLGRNRARIVRDFLVAQGVPTSKIIVDSKGESQPVASNNTDEGRAKNRRTELQIIK